MVQRNEVTNQSANPGLRMFWSVAHTVVVWWRRDDVSRSQKFGTRISRAAMSTRGSSSAVMFSAFCLGKFFPNGKDSLITLCYGTVFLWNKVGA
jgi:hypothetical protein